MRISSLFDSYKYHFIGAFFLLMLVVLAIKYYQVNSLRADLAESKAQVVILATTIDKQNDAIAKLGADSAKRLAIAYSALKKAKAVSKVRLPKINALQARVGDAISCEQAVDIAKGQL